MEKFDQIVKYKLDELSYDKEPDSAQMHSLFTRLDQDEEYAAPVIAMKPESNSFTIGLGLRIAASIAIVFLLGWAGYQTQNVKINTDPATHLTFDLPDGSSATLNASTSIQYNRLAWRLDRSVKLNGEAFFEVEKGKTFSVMSDQGTTTVLGTSFNVYARDFDYKVECFSGKVKVAVGDDQTLLTRGKAVRFDKGKKEYYQINSDLQTGWRAGQFYFDNEPLFNVMATLSRQFDIEVWLDESQYGIRYSGYFTNENLETALKLICDPLGLTFRIENKIVIIDQSGN